MASVNKFLHIKNFINEETLNLFYNYCFFKHRTHMNYFNNEPSSQGESFFYGDPIFDCLLLQKQNIIEQASNKKLIPLNSEFIVYVNNSVLTKRKNKHYQELTCTVNLGDDQIPWYLNIDDKELNLLPGEAVLFCGNATEFSRKGNFKGDHLISLNLHYCEDRRENHIFRYDGRYDIGLQK